MIIHEFKDNDFNIIDQREDLEKLEPNFRWQTYTDILPRDEQPLYAHNGAYRNNANAKGRQPKAISRKTLSLFESVCFRVNPWRC